MNFLMFFLGELSVFETIEKISTIIIAACSLAFSYYIFKYQSSKDDNDLKLDWYKLIVIESKFESFFSFFDGISNSLSKLKVEELTFEIRDEVNKELLERLNKIDLDFVSLLLAVDKMLYECVKNQLDKLVDGITVKLSDEELMLNDDKIFNDEISNHIADYKTQLLKMFVEFRGKNDTHKSILDSFKEKYL